MKKIKVLSLVLSSIIFLTFFTGCAGKKIISQAELDTPQNAYNQGMELLNKGDYLKAVSMFDRSIGLDKKFAYAYLGKGIAYLHIGDYKKAEKNVKKMISLDKKNPQGYVAYGRVNNAKGELNKALNMFEKALDLDTETKEAYFYMGETFEMAEENDEAKKQYKSAIEIDAYYNDAIKALEKLQKREIAMTGMDSEYVAIANKDAVTRADCAALLVEDFKVEKYLRKTDKVMLPTDSEMHWAKGYIEKVLAVGAMEEYSDRSFKPDEKITRVEFAMLLEKLIIKATGEEDLATKFVGSVSPYSDVPNTHFAFNAIMVVTSRNIMESKGDGTFGAAKIVTGTDAILALKKLKVVLEQ
ncbi:S-layer homology domain-containing protein [bacterium]